MNPYEIDIEKLKDSEKVTSENDIVKFQLVSEFLKAIAKKETSEVLALTGLHKSDLSRIKALSVERFSIDKIISLLSVLGFKTSIKVKKVS